MILYVYIEKVFEYLEGNYKGNFKIKLILILCVL